VICLELAIHHPRALTGLVLVEPAALALVPEATEALSAQRAALEQAMRDRGPPAAIDVWLEGWEQGPDHDLPGDPDRRTRARRTPGAFFADYAGLASWPVRRRELRELTVPTRLVDGPATPGHLVAAGVALSELIPGARRRSDGDVAAAVLDLLED
jgi:pimeloyl-ACP methyl ester carboxylesterase